MKKILIVDDHIILRQGLVRTLLDILEQPCEFAQASSGEDAIRMVHYGAYDLVLLDISLPDQNGLNVLGLLKQQHPELPVVMLSSHSDEQYSVRSLRAGAAGYVNKGCDSALLKDVIEKALTGTRYISQSQADLLLEALNTKTEGMPLPEMLSDREYQLVSLMAAGKTLTQISRELSVSSKTLSTYRTRVLEKLQLKTTADIISYGIHHGLVEKTFPT
jgi:two-component system, NarL family, invasion response regulator UvrY